MNETETRSITLTEFQWTVLEIFVDGFGCQDAGALLAHVGDGRYTLRTKVPGEGGRSWIIYLPDWLGTPLARLVAWWYGAMSGTPPGSTEPPVEIAETRHITLTPAQWATLDTLATAHNQPDIEQLLIGLSSAQYTITGRASV